jgi:acyl-CoA thioester hydrolase
MSSEPASSRVVRCEYRVIYGDTDQMGVVYYANYLGFFERGRCEYLRAAGVSYQEIEDAGHILPVTECVCRYRAPARFDDLLVIDTQIVRVSRIRVEFAYRILRTHGESEELLVEGSTTHACLTKELRPTRLPAALAERLR